MIAQILECKSKATPENIAAEWGISIVTAKKYLNMTEDDIRKLDNAHKNKRTRVRLIDNYVNIVYKMMCDGIDDVTIFHYIREKGVKGATDTIWEYIQSIGIRNFPNWKTVSPIRLLQWQYPADVIVIKRNQLLKYILTVNPKTKKDKIIGEYIDIIKNKFPAVEKVRTMFCAFYEILMGNNPDALHSFLDKYDKSEISGFCDGIKHDIVPVTNAISMKESSGFVEGCNNKFKFIKRAMYGRAKLPHLTQKCFLAFSIKKENFNLFDLI